MRDSPARLLGIIRGRGRRATYRPVEGMAQIMNAGTVPMPPELFYRAKAYSLAHRSKVVSGTTVGDAIA